MTLGFADKNYRWLYNTDTGQIKCSKRFSNSELFYPFSGYFLGYTGYERFILEDEIETSYKKAYYYFEEYLRNHK